MLGLDGFRGRRRKSGEDRVNHSCSIYLYNISSHSECNIRAQTATTRLSISVLSITKRINIADVLTKTRDNSYSQYIHKSI